MIKTSQVRNHEELLLPCIESHQILDGAINQQHQFSV